MISSVHVVGGGLAGCEAAWQAAERGVRVVLHEMRPARTTAVHRTDRLAELVCSNSFRSDDSETNAVGLLHYEMRRLGSLVIRAADANQVPAGGALAVAWFQSRYDKSGPGGSGADYINCPIDRVQYHAFVDAIHFGLFPPLDTRFRGPERSRDKKLALSRRAKTDLESWLAGEPASEAAA